MFAKGLKVETDLNLWHKRVGHINLQKLQNMQSKGVVIGLPNFTAKVITGLCGACQFGKQHRHPFPKERNVSKGILNVVHSNVWGPAQTSTLSTCRYYVMFIDNFFRNTWIYAMKQKRSKSVRILPEIQSQSCKSYGLACTLPSIGWRKRIHFE